MQEFRFSPRGIVETPHLAAGRPRLRMMPKSSQKIKSSLTWVTVLSIKIVPEPLPRHLLLDAGSVGVFDETGNHMGSLISSLVRVDNVIPSVNDAEFFRLGKVMQV